MYKKTFGIIGYIGSGKSEVLKELHKQGYEIISSDEIVDDLYQKENSGWQKIVTFFGDDYLTKGGEINRKKILNEVTKKPQKLEILNKLIHPLVNNEILKKIDKLDMHKPIFIELPVPNTAFIKKNIYKIIKIDTNDKIILQRLLKNPKKIEYYKKLLQIQKKSFKLKPDYIIKNNGIKRDLKNEIKKMLKYYKLLK